jgi:hypothetical protein
MADFAGPILENEVNTVLEDNRVRSGQSFQSTGKGRNKILGKRVMVQNKINKLGDIAIGCEMWTSDWLFPPLDRTNDRLYKQM